MTTNIYGDFQICISVPLTRTFLHELLVIILESHLQLLTRYYLHGKKLSSYLLKNEVIWLT